MSLRRDEALSPNTNQIGTKYGDRGTDKEGAKQHRYLSRLLEMRTRIRFGDIDCPHCGLDLEDGLHQWAERLVDEILG